MPDLTPTFAPPPAAAPVVAHDPAHNDPDAELAPGVTRRQAAILSAHANIVQGGFSPPEREAERASRAIAAGEVIDYDALQAEVTAALAIRNAEEDARAARDADDLLAANPDLADAGADPSVLDIAKVRRYRELRAAQSASEAEGKAMKEEADKLEAELVEMFAEAGLQNLNVDGKTIYLHRSTYAQWQAGLEQDDKLELLRRAGAGDLIKDTVNAQTLNAYVRELVDVDDAPGLPEPLRDVLELGERFAVRITAGGSRKKSQTRSK